MRAFPRIPALVLTLAMAACATAPRVPVEGSRTDLSGVEGEWAGTYTSPELGRAGTIWFKITPGDTSARGFVRLVPRTKLTVRIESDPVGWRELQPAAYLDIRFVQVSGSSIFGELVRYWDPDAGCWAVTVFRGWRSDGRLLGTFTTRLATGAVAAGQWEATRLRRDGR